MTIELLAALELVVFLAGAVAAGPFARWMSRSGDVPVKMMAYVASWSILFGMIPFFVFAVFASSAPSSGPVGTLPTLILNVIPFALAASPVIGVIQGYRAGRSLGRP